jgi:S1-C subfamily serine protease
MAVAQGSHFHSPEQVVASAAASSDYDAQLQAALAAQQHAQMQMQAVVKIFVRSVDTSYTSPWQKMDAETSTGSGFHIGSKLILTNAHVVYNGVSVRVQRPGLAGQFEGKVVCIARQCDLALVQVANDRFWEDLPQVGVAKRHATRIPVIALCRFPVEPCQLFCRSVSQTSCQI